MALAEQTSPEHFDLVVVGSGFGGSVMAYRAAEAGLRVCLLERGRSYPPGSFPRSPYRMKTNLWDPSEGLYGMFSIWSFTGIDVVAASGLGGGSLIYGSALIRKDERWFVREEPRDGGYEYWPVTRNQLEPHYDRAERMLNAQTYPMAFPPYAATPRTLAFRQAAERLGLDWFNPKLAVTFANPGHDPAPGEPIAEEFANLHGRTRLTCRLCGECDLGCNYGSKNTLDYTYLSAAQRFGAELRPLCEVRSFAPRRGGGYAIDYVRHEAAHEGRPTMTHDPAVLPPRSLTADRLVLAAGTLGSTFLLLKNAAAFPGLSGQLGTRFGGNGDMLTLALNCSDMVGGQRVPRIVDASYGPVVTIGLRVPDALDGGEGRGFYIEDAGYPEFFNWILQANDINALLRLPSLLRRLVGRWLRADQETNFAAELSRLYGSTELSAGLLPMIATGRDVADGRMRLERGILEVDWRNERAGPYFDRVNETMGRLIEALGGTRLQFPTWYLNRLISAHPLGGCPMGRHAGEWVVDAHGEVFGYPGLYVADGSVMPGPVGANPSLTIAALADRFADRLIAQARR